LDVFHGQNSIIAAIDINQLLAPTMSLSSSGMGHVFFNDALIFAILRHTSDSSPTSLKRWSVNIGRRFHHWQRRYIWVGIEDPYEDIVQL
jgi:hypothetical protein